MSRTLVDEVSSLLSRVGELESSLSRLESRTRAAVTALRDSGQTLATQLEVTNNVVADVVSPPLVLGSRPVSHYLTGQPAENSGTCRVNCCLAGGTRYEYSLAGCLVSGVEPPASVNLSVVLSSAGPVLEASDSDDNQYEVLPAPPCLDIAYVLAYLTSVHDTVELVSYTDSRDADTFSFL